MKFKSLVKHWQHESEAGTSVGVRRVTVLNLDRGQDGRAARLRRDPLRGGLRATACSSRAASSRTRPRSSATTSRPSRTIPAEIRAPAGSLPGVSGFQLHFADHDILTPGDRPDVLVAMNPAALKTNLKDLVKGGTLIVNRDAFTERNLDKAGYAANPLDDGSLGEYQVHEVPLTTMTIEALKEIDVTKREAERAKNMFALGLMSWLFNRPTEGTRRLPRQEVREARRTSATRTSRRCTRATRSARRPRRSPSGTR